MERYRPVNEKEDQGGIRKIGQLNEYLKSFTVNGIEWTLVPVEPDNTQLLDELGNYRLTITDFPKRKFTILRSGLWIVILTKRLNAAVKENLTSTKRLDAIMIFEF